MTFLLRRLVRSRGLRALSALAWLMLVVTSLAATPSDARPAHACASASADGGMDISVHHETAQGHAKGCAHDHTDCCGAHPSCGCASLCASVLPPTAVRVATAMPPTAAPSLPLPARAPSTTPVPPLRPPAA